MNANANKKKNITASAQIKASSGQLDGIIVNSHTAGTLKIWNSLTASGDVMHNTITLAVGERWIPFFDEGFDVGLFVTISGTADITVIYS